VRYIRDLLDQFFRETGIPKSVFNSEGLANVSTETVEHLLQSLRVRVDDKRTRVNAIVAQMVKMYFKDKGIDISKMEVRVIWPDLYAQPKSVKAKLVQEAHRSKLVSDKYASQKIVEILGDAEDFEDIYKEKLQMDEALRSEIEAALATSELENASASVSDIVANAVSTRNRDVNTPTQ